MRRVGVGREAEGVRCGERAEGVKLVPEGAHAVVGGEVPVGPVDGEDFAPSPSRQLVAGARGGPGQDKYGGFRVATTGHSREEKNMSFMTAWIQLLYFSTEV